MSNNATSWEASQERAYAHLIPILQEQGYDGFCKERYCRCFFNTDWDRKAKQCFCAGCSPCKTVPATDAEIENRLKRTTKEGEKSE